jgi:hypothetical protein
MPWPVLSRIQTRRECEILRAREIDVHPAALSRLGGPPCRDPYQKERQ